MCSSVVPRLRIRPGGLGALYPVSLEEHDMHVRMPVQVNMRISSTFSSKLSAVSVVVLIPVPDNTSSADIQVQPSRYYPEPRYHG